MIKLAYLCWLLSQAGYHGKSAIIKPLMEKDSIEIAGMWWTDNKGSAYEGYELRPNGELRLLDWETANGISWERKNNQLILKMQYRSSGKIIEDVNDIESLTPSEMALSFDFRGTYSKTVWNRMANGDFTDRYFGHWDGPDGKYIQVIHGYSSFSPKVILGSAKEGDYEKYSADLNEDHESITFELDGKEMELVYQKLENDTNAKAKIVFKGITYTR